MRRLLATLLALLACVLLPVALVAGWLVAVVDDTDRYVGTVGPLASDPRVVSAVEQSLSERTLGAVEDSVPLGADLQAQLEPLVTQGVTAAVESDEFRPVWEAANADAHTQLLAQLRASGEAVGDDVVLDFGSVLDTVVAELDGSLPVTLPEPGVTVPVVLLQGEQVSQARQGYDLLAVAGFWLPLVWVALVVVALLLSPLRTRLLGVLGIGSALTLGLLLVALGLARDRVVSQVPVPDSALSGAVWDGVTTSLDRAVHVGFAGCLVLLVLAALGGVVRGRRTA